MSWRRHSTGLSLGCALAIFAIPAARADLSTSSTGPWFSAAGIVQAATQTAEALAPNTIATIYGTNLSWTTRAVTVADLNGGALPISVDGVSVYVNGILCNLFYISPGQINFLIPYEVTASVARVIVARDGIAGPSTPAGVVVPVVIRMANTAPGFFQWTGLNFAVAEHADGSLISPDDPARPGEVVVLFGTGLGRTVPATSSGRVAVAAASSVYESEVAILLNGVPSPPANLYYAGLTPGCAGLYQVNVRLPPVLGPDPEIQIVIGMESSPAAIRLFVR
jgi:uncharacterized protein (TIGR03437 family)